MLRMITSAALMVALVGGAQAADPQTEDQKTLYALGLALSRNLATFELTQEELGFVTQGMEDGVLKKEAKVDSQAYQPKIGLRSGPSSVGGVKEKAAGGRNTSRRPRRRRASRSFPRVSSTRRPRRGPASSPRRRIASRSTTTALSPTARCSTARSSAVSPRPSR